MGEGKDGKRNEANSMGEEMNDVNSKNVMRGGNEAKSKGVIRGVNRSAEDDDDNSVSGFEEGAHEKILSIRLNQLDSDSNCLDQYLYSIASVRQRFY